MTLEQLAALLIESYFYKKKQELGRHLTKSELDKVWRDILSEGGIPRKFDKSHDDIFKIIQTHVEVRQEEDVSIVKDVRRWPIKKKEGNRLSLLEEI